MFFTPTNDFGFNVDNFGATYTSVGLGTSVSSHASDASLYGSNTQLLVGIAEDCYGIAICLSGGHTATTNRLCYLDILVDPAAGVGGTGSSWSVAIAQLFSGSAAYVTGNSGHWFYFPLFFKAGTAIGAKHQSIIASAQTIRVSVRLFGKPSHPELLRYGTKVQAIGTDTSVPIAVSGLAITAGNGVYGSWTTTSLTTSFDAWWWQVGFGVANTVTNGRGYLYDVAINADTTAVLCGESFQFRTAGTLEQSGKSAMGSSLPIRNIASGSTLWVRGACDTTVDTGLQLVIYALGG